MSSLQYFKAVRFEAARQLPKASDHEARRHGHGFCATLSQSSEVNPVLPDYLDLNTLLTHPTDPLVLERLLGDSWGALASTPERGVRRDPAGRWFAYRVFRFESAHQLPNVPPGHKCGRLHGHGFKAVIHVPVLDVQCSTHQDYARIETAWAPLGALLDRQLLNRLPGLENPTSEWLAVWIWNALRESLPDCAWVTVYETESCGAHYDGQTHRIWKDFTMDSAVTEAGEVLGHTWCLRLHLLGPLHPVFGWTLDFAEMKRDFEPLFMSLDHQPLHESKVLSSPDLGGIAEFIHAHGPLVLPQLGRVDVFESSGRGVSLDWGLNGLQVLP